MDISQYSSLYYSKRNGSLLSDNISNQYHSTGQLLMTCLSVSLKAFLKAMNTNKCHIHVLLQLYVKNAGKKLFLNDFSDNFLMHLGRNDCNFRAYCKLENQKSRK